MRKAAAATCERIDRYQMRVGTSKQVFLKPCWQVRLAAESHGPGGGQLSPHHSNRRITPAKAGNCLVREGTRRLKAALRPIGSGAIEGQGSLVAQHRLSGPDLLAFPLRSC